MPSELVIIELLITSCERGLKVSSFMCKTTPHSLHASLMFGYRASQVCQKHSETSSLIRNIQSGGLRFESHLLDEYKRAHTHGHEEVRWGTGVCKCVRVQCHAYTVHHCSKVWSSVIPQTRTGRGTKHTFHKSKPIRNKNAPQRGKHEVKVHKSWENMLKSVKGVDVVEGGTQSPARLHIADLPGQLKCKI